MAYRRRYQVQDRPKRHHIHAVQWLHDERFWIIVAIGILVLLMAVVLWTGTQAQGPRPPTVYPYQPF